MTFSLAEYVTLRLVGMDRLDAVCHTFSTMGTGGFSTRANSIESFQSPQIEMVITVFMILAGINFTQHYRLFVQWRPQAFFGDMEIRSYLLLILLATLFLAINLYFPKELLAWEALRKALFQVVSILTTTGFTSTNFEAWPPFAQLLLLALMFCGGCTGSTAGGLKTARIALLMRVVGREFRRMVERRGVFAIRLKPGCDQREHRSKSFKSDLLGFSPQLRRLHTADGDGGGRADGHSAVAATIVQHWAGPRPSRSK